MGKETNQADRIHPIPLFKAEAAKILGMPRGVTDGDLRVILKYLERDKSAIVYDNQASAADFCRDYHAEMLILIRLSNSEALVRLQPNYQTRTEQFLL